MEHERGIQDLFVEAGYLERLERTQASEAVFISS